MSKPIQTSEVGIRRIPLSPNYRALSQANRDWMSLSEEEKASTRFVDFLSRYAPTRERESEMIDA